MEIYLDIETIPEQPEEAARNNITATITAPGNISKAETIQAWHNGEGKYAGVKEQAIDTAYRKTALDGGKGSVCSIGFASGLDDITVITDQNIGEKALIATTFQRIAELLKKPQHESEPYFIGHFVPFDLKFLWQRAVILGVRPPFKLPFNGRHEQHYFDNMQAWAGYRDTISQNDLTAALSLPGKPDDIDGSRVWDYYKEGNYSIISEYNYYDLKTVIQVYRRITFRDAA